MIRDVYPGPVPLDENNQALLYGRSADIERLVNATLTRKVVEVTAPSGTGKSSLLMAGLRPALTKRGLTVAIVRSWADVSGDAAVEYYHAAIRRALIESDIVHESDDDPETDLGNLADRFGGRLVILFDQLEELMRLDPSLGQRFVATVAFAARELPFRQILSLRSEFKEELDVLESDLSRSLWTWLRVQPVSPEAEFEIVASPAKAAGFSFSDDTVERILALWRKARVDDRSIGLLHLQAMLWVIHQQSAPRRGQVLKDGPLGLRSSLYKSISEIALETHAGTSLATPAIEVARASLQNYAEMRLGEFELAYENSRIARETRFVIARLVEELSSAGYKVPRDLGEIFFNAYDDMEDLRWDEDEVYRLLELVTEWYEEEGSTQLTEPEVVIDLAHKNGITAESIDLDVSLLAGRLVGFDAVPAVAEAIVTFERAIEWLRKSSIVRVTKDLGKRRIVTLVHDGYGVALNRWGEKVLESEERYLDAPFGANGREVLDDDVIDGGGVRELRGLRWPSCMITKTRLKGLRFVECDLHGTVFTDCDFEDVAFCNCNMAGAIFDGGRITGQEGLRVEGSETKMLTFRRVILDGGGLALRGIRQDGLFLDHLAGGPWALHECEFRHLSVIGAETGLGPGMISESTLYLVHLDMAESTTTVRKSNLHYLDARPEQLVDGGGMVIR